jgi:hypothetical protein
MLRKYLAGLALSLVSATCATAGDAASGVGDTLYLSKDNEDFAIRRAGIEYLPRFKHGDALAGVRYTAHHYEQGDWSRHGEQVAVLYREIDPAIANGW